MRNLSTFLTTILFLCSCHPKLSNQNSAGQPRASAELALINPATGIIDPARAIDWAQSGIPGGIPNRTIVYTTIAAGASQATIQSALDSCPADQVVKLSAGTYNISGGLTIPSHVVLRGSGPRQTILNASGTSDGFIRFGQSITPSISNSVSITGGSNQGSTSLTLSSTSGVSVGSYLMVTQLNDPNYVTITTTNGTCNWCDGGLGWNGTRAQGQIVEVTSVSGNSVGVSPGLYLTYSLTPLATSFSMGAKYAGVEDLQVYMNNTGFTGNFYMSGSAYSWIKNVESNYTDGDHAQLHWSYRNEIRDSYFHDAFTHSPGSTDADIFVADKTSGTLIENNTLRRLHQSIMLNWGAAGNVIAYNYIDGNFDSGGYNTLFGGLNTHGSHPMFNLWEANIAPKLDADYFWGSSSHNTAFRNWFKGITLITPPLTGRGAEQPSNAYWASQALAAMDISQTAKYYNFVGNVLGSDQQKTLGWTPLVVAPQNRSYYSTNNPFGYTFGYANLTDGGSDSGDSSLPYSTALIHGDYDYVQGIFRWNSTITNHNLPASLYLASKPTWFGNLSWPAFGPDMSNPNLALLGSLPAKTCFDQGLMPNCLSSGSPTPTPSPSPTPTPTPAPSPSPTPSPTPTPTPTSGSMSLFTTQSPALIDNSDGVGINYELGMRFYATTNGQISAIKFYKSPLETGNHTGRIYSAGTLLASVTFTNESASGWQTQALSTPLSINAKSEYVVSVNTGNSYYVATSNGLASQITNQYLVSSAGANGVYGSVGAMPTNSWQYSNYFRDVVFVKGTTPTPTPTPFPTPSIASFTASPASITTGQSSTLNFSVSGTTVLTLNPGNLNVTGTSSKVVSPSASTTYTLTATNSSGSVSKSIAVTVIAASQRFFTTQIPASLNDSDGAGVNYELGMRFTSTAAGKITAIRFYKASSESGTHIGKIYSSAGALLAQVTFSGESASGWQQINLSTPLSIAANTEYTVSVNTGNTYYVATESGLASQVSSPNLRSVVGSNGVYGPVGSRPTQSWNNSNYFRDIIFTAN